MAIAKKAPMTDIYTANEVDPSKLEAFLREVYPQEKANFIAQHGLWRHRNIENRYVMMADDRVVAYCATIPGDCTLNGQRESALWWVDLIVLPEYRGRGYQRSFDAKMQALSPTKLGFPNDLAAGIHKKHGWGVTDGGYVLACPLNPTKLRTVQRQSGLKGLLYRLAGLALSVPMGVWKQRAKGYQARYTQATEAIDPVILAQTFDTYTRSQAFITTYRDADYFQWRYLDAPYAEQLRFYLTQQNGHLTQVAVVREVAYMDGVAWHILDVFGDLDDEIGLADLLRTVVRDAVRRQAYQLSTLSFLPQLWAALRKAGFIIRRPSLFCWVSQSDTTMAQLNQENFHWMPCDSDFDEAL